MNNDELFDITQFPDFLNAVIHMSDDVDESPTQVDENGLIERPFLPLRGMVLFPNMVTPLFVGRDRSLAALQAAIANDESLIVAAQKDPEVADPSDDDLYTIGVEMGIGRSVKLPDGSNSVMCQGKQRVEIVSFVQWEPYIRVLVRPIPEPDTWDKTTEPLMRAVLDLFEKAVELNRRLPDDALTFAINADKPGWLADFVVTTLDLGVERKQSLLEMYDPMERLQRVSVILAKEVDLLEAENRIHQKVQEEVDRSQRDHFLREQMRAIQSELGEADVYTQELNELREAVARKEFPIEVRNRIDKELARLSAMPPMSPEMGVIRNYLDWLIDLPWQKRSEDNFDVNNAADILAEDHYALDKVKDRILEYIAVKQMAGDEMRTPILCFVGPPGTGKTSIGKSIAKALNREFIRMSLGGVRDEAEIRGHRRTYIGALPGRIIQSIRKAGTNNPLIMLDEIDKLGNDFRGDPASALLEVLDPEQNHTFRDHFVELDFDLSETLFVTTANDLTPIPAALRDRMEIIEFSGYLDEEKIEIARQFIVPRQLRQNGLKGQGIKFTDEAIHTIIRQYTYEAGVRNLEREVANVSRKVARKVADGSRVPRTITPARVSELLGSPRFAADKLRECDEIGVATGVAWTSGGGDTLDIEVNLMAGSGKLVLTGKLGDVMQESARAALTYTRSQAKQLGVDPERFAKTDVHIHVPEGAVPKDGPSAGVPLSIALISAFTNRPIKRDVGMTGEITLRGRVLPVGGVREKAMAARRVGISKFVMPKQNHSDLQNIPEALRRDLKFVEVSHVSEVLNVALGKPLSA